MTTDRHPNFSIGLTPDEERADHENRLARRVQRTVSPTTAPTRSQALSREELEQDGQRAEKLRAAIQRLRALVDKEPL